MRNILVTCAGIIVGIFISPVSVSSTSILFWFFVSLTIGTIVFVDARFFQNKSLDKKTKRIGYSAALFFVGITCGLFRVAVFDHFIPRDLEKFEGQKVVLQGEIINSPVSNGLTQKFVLELYKGHMHGRVLVSADLFPIYHYGDVVQVRGKLKKPEIIDSGTGVIFDYPHYLLKDGITESVGFASVKMTGPNQGNAVIRFLYQIRAAFVKAIGNILPEPQAGLLSGIVLGTQTVSPALTNNFRTAGLSHIVVLSGYNITIVAESVMAIALYINPGVAPFVALGGVVLFVLMSGAGASAIRAGIMAVVALLGRRFGKTYDAGRALFFASFLMVIWNPLTLLYDPSFHLSFLATFAMIYVSPLTLEWLPGVTQKFGFQEILSTTIAVTIFVLPYIVFMAGKIALYSVPANILVLPLVPLTMAVGLVTAVFGFLVFPLSVFGFGPGIISYVITKYDIFIASSISRIPYAQIAINHFSLVLLVVTYAVFAGLYYFYFRLRPISAPG